MTTPAHIGALAIRVSPDSSDFRKALKKMLEAAEKTARIEVSPVIDQESLRKLKAQIKAIDGTEASVSVRTDKSSLAKAKAQLNTLSDVSIDDIDIDTAALAQARARVDKALSTNIHPNVHTTAARAELSRLEKPLRVPVHADVKKRGGFKNIERQLRRSTMRAIAGASRVATRSATRIARSMRGVGRAAATVTGPLSSVGTVASRASRGVGKATRATASLTGSLRALAASGLGRLRSATNAALSGFRAFNAVMFGIGRSAAGVGRAMGTAARNVAMIAPALSSLGAAGLSGIASGVQGATTAVSGLWIALTKLTPLLGTLPAILAGGAAGFVAMKATINTAKEGLADYADTFKQMYDDIGRAAWATGGEQVILTVERLIPVLSDGMQKVGAAFGTMMGKVAAQLSSPRALAAISDVLDNTAAAMEPLGDALGWVVDGFLQLSRAGAPLLIRMAEYLRDLASNFSAWANEVYATGRMFVWVDEALHTIGQLIRIVRAAIGTFAALGRTMGVTVGGDALDRLAAGMEGINRVANNPTFQYALINLFSGADAAVRQLMPGVKTLAQTFARLTPLLSRLMVVGAAAMSALLAGLSDLLGSGSLQRGIEQMFNGVLAVAQDLRNFIPTLAPLLGNLAGVIGVILSAVGDMLPSLTPLVSVLANLAGNIGPAVVTVVRNLGAALSDPGLIGGIDALVNSVVAAVAHLSTLLPVLAPVVGVLLRLAGGSFSSFADGLTPVVQTFAPVISQLANQLLPVVQAVIGQLSRALTDPRLVSGIAGLGSALVDVVGIAGDLLPALAPVIGVLAQLAGVVATALAGTLMPILQALAPVVTRLAQTLIPVVQTVADALTAALTDPALISGIDSLVTGLASIIPVLAGLLPTIAPVIGQLLTAVSQIVTALVQGLAPVIEMLAPLLVAALSAIAPVIVSIIKVVAQGLLQLPKVFDFLAKAFGYVFEPLKRAWDNVKPVLEGMRDYVTGLFANMDMGEAFSRIGERLQPVIGMIESFAEACKKIIDAVGPVLKDVLGTIVTDMLPALYNGWKQIFDLVGASIGPIFGALQPALQPFLDTVTQLYDLLIKNAVDLWGVLANLTHLIAQILGAILPPILAVGGAIGRLIAAVLQTYFPLLERWYDWLRQMIEPIREIFEMLSVLLIPVIDWLAEKIAALQPVLMRVVDYAGAQWLNVVEFIRDIVGVITSIIQGDWAQAWQYAKDAVGEVMEFIGTLLTDLPGIIWDAVQALAGILWEAGSALASRLLEGIMDALRRGRDAVWNGIKGLFGGDDDGGNDPWLKADPGFGQPKNWSSKSFGNQSVSNRYGGGQTINIYNPVNEPSSETLRRNSAHLTGGY